MAKGGNFWDKYGIYFIIGSIAITLIIVIYTIGRKQGKILAENSEDKSPSIFDVPVDIPATGSTPLTEDEQRRVRSMTNRLYNDMSGLNVFGHDDDIYIDYNSMSDRLFVAVYNDFNNLHQDQGEGTLHLWLIDENFGSWGVVESILERMERLALP